MTLRSFCTLTLAIAGCVSAVDAQQEVRWPAAISLLGKPLHAPTFDSATTLRLRADLERAVASAERGFDLWKRTPAPLRGDVLRRTGDIMARRKDELARAMTREMGKVLAETLGDVQEGIDTAYYAAVEGRQGEVSFLLRVSARPGGALPRPRGDGAVRAAALHPPVRRRGPRARSAGPRASRHPSAGST